MSILPKASYILTATPIKFEMTFFMEIEKKILKILQKHKTLNSHRSLEKEEERVIIMPDLKPFYKSIIIKAVCYWHKRRHVRQ